MPYQGRARNVVPTTHLLILALCLLPGSLSNPISTVDKLGHAGDSYNRQPCLKNIHNGYPCLTAKTLDNVFRGQSPPCPGNDCDPEDTGSPFSPSSTDSASARSMSNPRRYPVVLLQYLISTAHANMARTKRYTGGQDEEAKIEDIAHGWRHGSQPTVPTVYSASAAAEPSFITRAAPSSLPHLDLKRNERKEALDWLDCNVRDVNIVERYLNDKCPIETVKVGRSGTESGIATPRQVDLSQSPLKIPAVEQIQRPKDGDDALTSDLDLNLTEAACGDNEGSEEGKNAWQSLGLGSALVGLWKKAQKAFQSNNAWP